ncbi:MAG: hypothetical protein JOZ99_01730 [Actinobacteria bacterium]|nr:hypothetical protein [Actinomycetota bacterium]
MEIEREWRRLEQSLIEIGTFLEQLAGRVADWGRSLEVKTGEMRADVTEIGDVTDHAA